MIVFGELCVESWVCWRSPLTEPSHQSVTDSHTHSKPKPAPARDAIWKCWRNLTLSFSAGSLPAQHSLDFCVFSQHGLRAEGTTEGLSSRFTSSIPDIAPGWKSALSARRLTAVRY